MSADDVIYTAMRKANAYIEDAINDLHDGFTDDDIQAIRDCLTSLSNKEEVELEAKLRKETAVWFTSTPSQRRRRRWTNEGMLRFFLLRTLKDAVSMLPLIEENGLCEPLHDYRSFMLLAADLFLFARATDDPRDELSYWWPFADPDPYVTRNHQEDQA